MKLFPVIISSFVLACGVNACGPSAYAAPKKVGSKSSLAASMYIRPYVAPAASQVIMDRLEKVEEQLGQTNYTFEYLMPKNTKIVLTILVQRNGVLDRKDSGVFHVLRYAEKDSVAGTLTFSRGYPQHNYNPTDHPAWWISLSNSGYGIFERTPADWMSSWSTEEKPLTGKAAQKDAVLFGFLPDDPKFTLVIKAHFASAPPYQNINGTKRYPLPVSVK